MSRTGNHPPLWMSLLATVSVAALWIVIRVALFHGVLLPLSYVLPLMVCVWTKRRWQLLTMAAAFSVAAVVEFVLTSSAEEALESHRWGSLGATVANVVIGTVAVYAIMVMRDRDDAQREELSRQNDELRAQAEELAQQQEELAQQNEEMAQQHEELQNQAEELEQQAETLQVTNQELAWREEALQMLLNTGRALIGEGEVLTELCRHGRRLLGEHVAGVAIVEARDGQLYVHSHDGVRTDSGALVRWPLQQSLAAVTMDAGRTGALEDMSMRPDLIFPRSAGPKPFRSILAAPIWVGGKAIGAVEFYGTVVRSWTEHEFRLAEWVAAQCSAALEAIRLRAEAERARGQVEAVFQAMADGVVVTDMSGRFVLVNEAEARINSYPSAAAMKRDVEYFASVYELRRPDGSILTPDQWPISRVLRGESVVDWELLGRRKDTGQQWYFSFSGEPVRNDQGEQVLAVIVTRDISRIKAAEEQLRRTNERLESASRAKDHFLAVLSHELRTPLTPVLMSVSEMLVDPGLSPQVLEDLAMIRRNVELETRLIDDLLDVTRIARGKLELQRHPTELRRIIAHAAETCTAEVRAKGLELTLDLGGDELQVDGDAARLQQVFWNLIKNAVKFTPAGRISVSCGRDDNGAVIRVADSGIGMEPHIVERIFNAFEQGGTGTTRKFGGLGLGLAITRALIEMHDGTVSAHSDGPGRGSVFTVRLPLSEATAAIRAAGQPAVPSVNGAGAGRVLLVEDHPDSARMLARLLVRSGWYVKTAGDVASALRTARAESFDIVVSDIGLPDGTGLDLMRQLRLEQPKLRGIALSGHGMEADMRLSREAGFMAHLVKPVNPQVLQQMIASVLDGETEASAV